MCASVHIQKILSFTSSNLDALLNHLIIFSFLWKKIGENFYRFWIYERSCNSDIFRNLLTCCYQTKIHYTPCSTFHQGQISSNPFIYFFLFIKKTKQKWSQNQVFSTKKHHYPQMIINMHIPDNTVSVLHSTYSTSTHNSNISWCNTFSSTPCRKVLK